MNYMTIYKTSLADGLGWRTVLFVSGCDHHCKGCHNKESWDKKAGTPFTEHTKEVLFDLCKATDGLTLSGGDPLYKANIDDVTDLCKEYKEVFPDKNIWLYTGSRFEDVKDLEVMKYVDVVVDGQFILSQRDTTLAFRGSKNQRIIDVRKNKEIKM